MAETFRIVFNKENQAYRIYLGNSRYLYLGKVSETVAMAIQSRMQSDLALGQFDATLERYKIDNPSKLIKQVPKRDIKELSLEEFYQVWIESLNLTTAKYNGKYLEVGKVIKRASEYKDLQKGLTKIFSEYKLGTIKTYKPYLNKFFQYCIKESYLKENPLESIKLNPVKSSKDNIKPLTKLEVNKIIDLFATKYPYYRDLTEFLFITGVRPSEALSLSWDKVNFEENYILIDVAIGKDKSLSPYSNRKLLKETKTGISGKIPLSNRLRELLISRYANYLKGNRNSKNLIFPGLKGGYLDWSKYSVKWKAVLTELNIVYRNPYQTRHTALSYVASSQGLLAAAKLARHTNSVTVAKHYARFTGDLELPDY
ncbi:tyrosine-type recombinase/integrase [Synechococcus sp. PCC 6312]|uniref:tyrosine-type recombinase/integrase n=1 Tax=Synechococcus sp. (strain ATCC 27167 / PCC 6312) TaxID=195253 RepID=UPI00029F11E6|nr:tyrosine-type recombinase/integrase [Synechococcus sp. PCC 6312]AFY60521.1 site-specific recombinase XerD [Synechococcus sp. PCC 6312]